METLISKSYCGAQTRLILPKVKDVAGVTGDNCSTRLAFKLPKPYASGWVKYIEFNCTVERDGYEIYPSYLLDENDSFLIPYEIASKGGEIEYNLRFVSIDGTVTEKSEMSTLYFRNTVPGTEVQPEPVIDVQVYLVNNAYCSVSYQDGTTEGSAIISLPSLTFTPMNEGGDIDTVTLNVPYLDSNGHILSSFIDKEIVVEIFHISSPDALTGLTQAQVPDMALIDQSSATETYYMDLYMLVGADPTDATNWYLVHTDNPTFSSVSATSADFNNTTTVGLSVTGNGTVAGNVSVTGKTTTGTLESGAAKFTGNVDASNMTVTASTFIGNVTGDVTGNAITATTAQNYDSSTGTIKDGLNSKAPTNHASNQTTYGVGSSSLYGHVKVDTSMSSDSVNPVQNSTIMSFVNSSIGTATANFLGTYYAGSHDPVETNDLEIPQNDINTKTEEQLNALIITKLGTKIVNPENNDYVFVAINFTATVDVDEYRRFKYSAPPGQTVIGWLYEYTLNNSSFTQAQWNAINSLVTNTTSNPHVGVDVKDINDHLGNSQIHVPTSSDATNSKVLANTQNGAPTWQTVSASNPTLAWGQESTIGTIAGQTFKVTMPSNPDTDTKVTQGYATNTADLRPVILSYAKTTDSGTGNVTNIVYRNNSIYANPGLGYLYATKVYSNDSEVVNLADAQTIAGAKTFSGQMIASGQRAYDASNTTDVVTIGSLQASTDVVHRTGNETIAGAKTFMNGPHIRNTNLNITTVPSSTQNTLLNYEDKNAVLTGTVQQYFFNDGHCQFSLTWNPYKADRSGQIGERMFGMRTDTSNNVYATSPSRSYSLATDSDVLTKAHVADMMSANVGNGQISLTSSRGTAIDNFTVNQSSGKNIVLPASSTQYTSQSVTFELQGTPDYAEYPYRASFAVTGITSDTYATVTYDETQVDSCLYAPFCDTASGYVYLYAKSNVGTVTIPTISVGMDDSSAQQSMSNFVTLTGNQTVAGVKTFTSKIITSSTFPEIDFKNTTLELAANPSTTLYGLVFVRDKNDTEVASYGVRKFNTGLTDWYAYVKASSNISASFGMRVNTREQYMYAPSRTYNTSNINDIVTIMSLQASTDVVHTTGNETIGGDKTFTGAINKNNGGYLTINTNSTKNTTEANQYFIYAKINAPTSTYTNVYFFAYTRNVINAGLYHLGYNTSSTRLDMTTTAVTPLNFKIVKDSNNQHYIATYLDTNSITILEFKAFIDSFSRDLPITDFTPYAVPSSGYTDVLST